MTALDKIERESPEWQPWIAVLRVVLDALEEATPPRRAGAAHEAPWAVRLTVAAERSEGAPLLDGAEIHVDEGRVANLLARMARVGANDLATPEVALAIIAASIRADQEALEAAARAAGLGSSALATIAQGAAVPILHVAATQLSDDRPAHWPRGYCPWCGAWPVLAELRGLDRSRHLRCGRCGGDWVMLLLTCPFCGERDHHRLGALVSEETGHTRSVETCASCRGYLKTFTTLRALTHAELLVKDLETVELDLVALERGFARPATLGFAPHVHLRPAGQA